MPLLIQRRHIRKVAYIKTRFTGAEPELRKFCLFTAGLPCLGQRLIGFEQNGARTN
jgi:hypothetical protein